MIKKNIEHGCTNRNVLHKESRSKNKMCGGNDEKLNVVNLLGFLTACGETSYKGKGRKTGFVIQADKYS